MRELFYTDDNRLQRVKERTSAGAVIFAEHLFTDGDGRIEGLFRRPFAPSILPPEDAMTHDFDNRIATWTPSGGSLQTVAHDADGNMTTGPLPNGKMGAYGYNSRNWLTSANGSSYRYSAEGHRVEITGTGAATFVVDPNAALSRTLIRVKGGVTTYYVYGLELLYEDTGGAPKYYHADKVGSTMALTDASQNVIDRWDYAPFGAEVRVTGTTDTPFRFNGAFGVMTESSGLLHMRARYYNPRILRFVNADPIGFAGGMNWYAFANNNPISKFDPFGLRADWAQFATGAAEFAGGFVLAWTALGTTAATAGVGTPAAIFIGLTAGSLMVHGMTNMAAAFSPDEKMAKVIKESPATPVQGLGRLVGGKTGQNVAGLAESVVNVASNVANSAKALEHAQGVVEAIDATKTYAEDAIESLESRSKPPSQQEATEADKTPKTTRK